MLTTKKVFLEENTKDVARPSLDKEITGTTHELNQSLSRSQEYRWDYTSRNTTSWDRKETEEVGWNEGRLTDFLDSARRTIELFACECALFLKKREE